MMFDKTHGRNMLTIEAARNAAGFRAFYYTSEGVVEVKTFSDREGWTTADVDEMITEALVHLKKNWKKIKLKPPEEPS